MKTAAELKRAADELMAKALQLEDEAAAKLVETNREFNGRTWALDAPGGRIVAKAELRKKPGSKPYVMVTIEGPPDHGPYMPLEIEHYFIAEIAAVAPVQVFYVSRPFWGRRDVSRTSVASAPCPKKLAMAAAFFSGAITQEEYDRFCWPHKFKARN